MKLLSVLKASMQLFYIWRLDEAVHTLSIFVRKNYENVINLDVASKMSLELVISQNINKKTSQFLL